MGGPFGWTESETSHAAVVAQTPRASTTAAATAHPGLAVRATRCQPQDQSIATRLGAFGISRVTRNRATSPKFRLGLPVDEGYWADRILCDRVGCVSADAT